MAILTNNLGAVSDLEMNIVTREALEQLEARGVRVRRAYSGRCITSQEMPGFSLTILHVDDETTRLFGLSYFPRVCGGHGAQAPLPMPRQLI